MAGNKSTEIMVPSRINVYLGPVGTVVPEDARTAPGVGWYSVGYTPDDSLTFATEPTFQEVRSAQSDYATRRFQVSDAASIAVDLQQWNLQNYKAAMGGGTVTEVTPATTPKTYKYVPPKVGERGELAALVDVEDGGKHYRYVCARVFQNEGVQSQLHKGAESRLPLRLQVLGADTGDSFYLLTDDPAFASVP